MACRSFSFHRSTIITGITIVALTLGFDNNLAENALRGVALGRKNYMFLGADSGGDRAATMYSLIVSAKLNGIDPQAYLRHVLTHIADYPITPVAELLPWNVARHLPQLAA